MLLLSLLSVASADCDGPTLPMPAREYAYAGLALEGEVCFGSDGSVAVETWDARTGELVSLGEADVRDTEAYHGEYGSMDAEMHELIRELEGGAVEVDIWFGFADGLVEDKEELLETYGDEMPALGESRSADLVAAAASMQDEVLSVAPDTVFAADASSLEGLGAPVLRATVAVEDLYVLGALDTVWAIRRGIDAEAEGEPLGEEYINGGGAGVLDFFGIDGSGATVGIVEGSYPDSFANMSGARAGTCADDAGNTGMCHCAAGSTDSHNRLVAGVIANDATSAEGIADETDTLFANWSGSCKTHGDTAFSSATEWAVANGASILNFSWNFGHGSPQQSSDLYFDYLTSHTPWPLVVAAAGNVSAASRVVNNLRNGVVVGAADRNGTTTRSSATQTSWSHAANHGGASGFELPHISAQGVSVETAGSANGATASASGTSLAAPIVSGTAAMVHEHNAALKYWPEVVFAGLMVGADEDLDEASGGTWPLSLHDSIDDRDGAGLVSAGNTVVVLDSSKRVTTTTAAEAMGHDYGTVYQTGAVDTYLAEVAPGETLRVSSIFLAKPTCNSGEATGQDTCSATPYPTSLIALWGPDALVGYSFNPNTNYQLAGWKNDTDETVEVEVKLHLLSMPSGLSSTTWGLAWMTN